MRLISKEENGQVLNLVQALLGKITSDFRAVAISSTVDLLEIFFVLSRDSSEIRELIDWSLDDFESMNAEGVCVESVVLVDERPFSELDLPDRFVFERNEPARS